MQDSPGNEIRMPYLKSNKRKLGEYESDEEFCPNKQAAKVIQRLCIIFACPSTYCTHLRARTTSTCLTLVVSLYICPGVEWSPGWAQALQEGKVWQAAKWIWARGEGQEGLRCWTSIKKGAPFGYAPSPLQPSLG